MKKQQLSTLENSRAYTLAVAEAMPENAYEFKPTEAVWNFRELMHHIAYGIQWWEENYIRENQTAWNPPAVRNNKKHVIDYLHQSYNGLKKTLESKDLSENAVKGFHATLDHITHHRGQGVTYLRCNGMTPPEYVY
jgi:uncharacterized damage-inducible protein DinB